MAEFTHEFQRFLRRVPKRRFATQGDWLNHVVHPMGVYEKSRQLRPIVLPVRTTIQRGNFTGVRVAPWRSDWWQTTQKGVAQMMGIADYRRVDLRDIYGNTLQDMTPQQLAAVDEVEVFDGDDQQLVLNAPVPHASVHPLKDRMLNEWWDKQSDDISAVAAAVLAGTKSQEQLAARLQVENAAEGTPSGELESAIRSHLADNINNKFVQDYAENELAASQTAEDLVRSIGRVAMAGIRYSVLNSEQDVRRCLSKYKSGTDFFASDQVGASAADAMPVNENDIYQRIASYGLNFGNLPRNVVVIMKHGDKHGHGNGKHHNDACFSKHHKHHKHHGRHHHPHGHPHKSRTSSGVKKTVEVTRWSHQRPAHPMPYGHPSRDMFAYHHGGPVHHYYKQGAGAHHHERTKIVMMRGGKPLTAYRGDYDKALNQYHVYSGRAPVPSPDMLREIDDRKNGVASTAPTAAEVSAAYDPRAIYDEAMAVEARPGTKMAMFLRVISQNGRLTFTNPRTNAAISIDHTRPGRVIVDRSMDEMDSAAGEMIISQFEKMGGLRETTLGRIDIFREDFEQPYIDYFRLEDAIRGLIRMGYTKWNSDRARMGDAMPVDGWFSDRRAKYRRSRLKNARKKLEKAMEKGSERRINFWEKRVAYWESKVAKDADMDEMISQAIGEEMAFDGAPIEAMAKAASLIGCNSCNKVTPEYLRQKIAKYRAKEAKLVRKMEMERREQFGSGGLTKEGKASKLERVREKLAGYEAKLRAMQGDNTMAAPYMGDEMNAHYDRLLAVEAAVLHNAEDFFAEEDPKLATVDESIGERVVAQMTKHLVKFAAVEGADAALELANELRQEAGSPVAEAMWGRVINRAEHVFSKEGSTTAVGESLDEELERLRKEAAASTTRRKKYRRLSAAQRRALRAKRRERRAERLAKRRRARLSKGSAPPMMEDTPNVYDGAYATAEAMPIGLTVTQLDTTRRVLQNQGASKTLTQYIDNYKNLPLGRPGTRKNALDRIIYVIVNGFEGNFDVITDSDVRAAVDARVADGPAVLTPDAASDSSSSGGDGSSSSDSTSGSSSSSSEAVQPESGADPFSDQGGEVSDEPFLVTGESDEEDEQPQAGAGEAPAMRRDPPPARRGVSLSRGVPKAYEGPVNGSKYPDAVVAEVDYYNRMAEMSRRNGNDKLRRFYEEQAGEQRMRSERPRSIYSKVPEMVEDEAVPEFKPSGTATSVRVGDRVMRMTPAEVEMQDRISTTTRGLLADERRGSETARSVAQRRLKAAREAGDSGSYEFYKGVMERIPVSAPVPKASGVKLVSRRAPPKTKPVKVASAQPKSLADPAAAERQEKANPAPLPTGEPISFKELMRRQKQARK
jgi:hypothetical protein